MSIARLKRPRLISDPGRKPQHRGKKSPRRIQNLDQRLKASGKLSVWAANCPRLGLMENPRVG